MRVPHVTSGASLLSAIQEEAGRGVIVALRHCAEQDAIDSTFGGCHDAQAGGIARAAARGEVRATMHANASSVRPGTAGKATPPFVVVEGANPAADAHLRRALGTAGAGGWRPVAGWIVPRGRIACHGVVASEADAVLALRAAVAGAGIIVLTAAPRDIIDRLVDDLRRLGPVQHVTADVPAPAAVDDEQRRLLRLLADGWTLGEAAAALGLARRTADRRLDAARRTLGADRTAEALAKARELGWFDEIGGPH